MTDLAVHFLPYGTIVSTCGRIHDRRCPERWTDRRKGTTCSECQTRMRDLGDLPASVAPKSERFEPCS